MSVVSNVASSSFYSISYLILLKLSSTGFGRVDWGDLFSSEFTDESLSSNHTFFKGEDGTFNFVGDLMSLISFLKNY